MMLLVIALALPDGPDERCVALGSPAIRAWLNVSGTLGHEVVLVPETPTDADARTLALALHADLVRSGERWRLVRHKSTEATLRKADREWVEDGIRAAVARFDDLSRPYADSPAEAPYRALLAARARFEARHLPPMYDESGAEAIRLVPGARLLADLLRKFPSELLDILPGESAVFSNAPVGEERPLPPNDAALTRYLGAQRRFADWSEAADAQGRIPESYRWAFAKGPFRDGPRTLRLTVDREGDVPFFGLGAYDPAGNAEGGGGFTPMDSASANAPTRTATVLGKATLPPDALANLAKYRANTLEPQNAPPDPAVRDPLDLFVRDALLLWGRTKGHARIVACVPDWLLGGVDRFVSGETLDLDALAGAIEQDCECLTEGDTLVVRPKHPLQEEATRVDRHPLSDLYRSAARGQYGLAELLAYHAAYVDHYDDRLALKRMELPVFRAFRLDSANTMLPHALLATLGTIPASERQRLSVGNRVSLAPPLYTACRRALARYAQRYATAPIVADTSKAEGGNVRIVFDTVHATATGSALERQDSRLLARPGLRDLEVVAVRDTPYVRRVSGDGQPLDRGFVPASMAVDGLPWNAQGNPDPSGCRVLWLPERRMDVRVRLGDGLVIGPYTLSERGPASKEAIPLDQVPGIVIPKRRLPPD